MKVTEIRIGFARTVNLGNYESARVEASVTVDCSLEDYEPATVQSVLRGLLEDTWKAQHNPKANK